MEQHRALIAFLYCRPNQWDERGVPESLTFLALPPGPLPDVPARGNPLNHDYPSAGGSPSSSLRSCSGPRRGPRPSNYFENGDAYQLRREGQPYFIRGAGGDEKLWGKLAASGGNSVRLWGDDRLGEQLDLARREGLTVTAGIWLPQIRQGFDYTDAQAVAGLREHVRRTVLRYKDHPALLLWALGNEMEDPQGRQPRRLDRDQ